jgi:replicative DNA helicase
MPFGIETIDDATGGLSEGDLAYIVGRPADGKTTLLLHLIAKWFCDGKNILLISNEIPWLDMLYKVDCILVGASVGEKRSGNFTQDTKDKMAALKYMQSIMDNKITIPDRPVRKPAELLSLITQHKPDIVCIDGAYMMSMTGASTVDWEDLAAVSRELKQIVNTENIPIVGVLQANRTAEGSKTVSGASIAGADAWFQDADIILSVRQDEKTAFGANVVLSTTKNRHGIQVMTKINYNFHDMTLGEVTKDV